MSIIVEASNGGQQHIYYKFKSVHNGNLSGIARTFTGLPCVLIYITKNILSQTRGVHDYMLQNLLDECWSMMHWGHKVTGTFTHDNFFSSHLPSQHGFKFNGSKIQFIGIVQILWVKSNTIHLIGHPQPL